MCTCVCVCVCVCVPYLWHTAIVGLLPLVLEERPQVTIGHEGEDNERKVVISIKADPKQLEDIGVIKVQHDG